MINHDPTLYRQISTCEENPTSPNGPNTHEAERDKSRPYTFHPIRFIAIICLQDTTIISIKNKSCRAEVTETLYKT